MADTAQIEEIVRQVLASMSGEASAAPGGSAGGAIPKTAHVAMLTGLEHFDVKEFPMPEVGDDDMLVRVEGCGICGTDAHEFKRDPFGLIPVALGHEGTGEIVKMGKNVKKDSAGKDLKLGDKVVTCMIFKDNPDITMFDLNKQNVGGADVYGLLPDDDQDGIKQVGLLQIADIAGAGILPQTVIGDTAVKIAPMAFLAVEVLPAAPAEHPAL